MTTPPPLVGATVIDADLYGRRGTILSARPDALAVTAQWRSGQFTTPAARRHRPLQADREDVMKVVYRERGHVEYEDGHVHHLPLSGWWTVNCYRCPVHYLSPLRDIGRRVGSVSHSRRADAIAALTRHLSTFHGRTP